MMSADPLSPQPPIALHRPDISPADLAALRPLLDSGMLVQGPTVAAFETAIARVAGRGHAVAVSNGTSALELTLAALGVEVGAEVLVPALTWPSPAHAVCLRGAMPRFVEVHPTRWNSEAADFARARTRETRAAIIIPQFGNPVDVGAIQAALPGVTLLIDGACVLGSSLHNAPATASPTRPERDIPVTLSFHPRKVLTTGEGGMILTDDAAFAQTVRTLRNHGLGADGTFLRPGGNSRLTELGAALGLQQLPRLEGVLAQRRAQRAYYAEHLPAGTLQEAIEGALPNAQSVGMVLRDSRARDTLLTRARAEGVGIGHLSYCLPLLPSLAAFGNPADVPEAARIASCGLTLPCHTGLTPQDQDRVIALVNQALAA